MFLDNTIYLFLSQQNDKMQSIRIDEDGKKFSIKWETMLKTCLTCRQRGGRHYHNHRERRKEETKQWKLQNSDYVKEMNEFYRTTTSFSKNEVSIIKREKEIRKNEYSLIINDVGEQGKTCAIPKCGWKPISFFQSNEFTRDKLSSTCVCCAHIRSMIRDTIINDINTKLKRLLRDSNFKNEHEIHPFLNCSIINFKHHIESLFHSDMSWEKWGFFTENGKQKLGFHIDHILPISCFDLTNIQEFYLCFHWKNCQPLWASDNMSKKNTFQLEERVRYFEEMTEKITMNSVMFQTLIDHVLQSVENNIDKLKVDHKTHDFRLGKMLFDEYLHDQCLEGIELMCFMNENNIRAEDYKATPIAVMRNHQSRKSGSENPRSKKVCQLSTEGELIHLHESMNIAAKDNQTFHASISKCCSNPLKLYTSGGYLWCFEDSFDEVQFRSRWKKVLVELVQHVQRYEQPLPKYTPPPRSKDIKTKIGESMKTFFATEEGRKNKRKPIRNDQKP